MPSYQKNQILILFSVILLSFKLSLVLFKFSHKYFVELNLLSYDMLCIYRHKIQSTIPFFSTMVYDTEIRFCFHCMACFVTQRNKSTITITITVRYISYMVETDEKYFEYVRVCKLDGFTTSNILYCHWVWMANICKNLSVNTFLSATWIKFIEC